MRRRPPSATRTDPLVPHPSPFRAIAPAAVAALRPAVEIHALAAVVDVAVDRAGAAQRLAARRPDPPPAGPLARLNVVEPVHRRIDHGLHEVDRKSTRLNSSH